VGGIWRWDCQVLPDLPAGHDHGSDGKKEGELRLHQSQRIDAVESGLVMHKSSKHRDTNVTDVIGNGNSKNKDYGRKGRSRCV